MRYFVLRKVNPSLSFSRIEVDDSAYLNPACFQVMYLFWKNPCTRLTDAQESEFQRLFEAMLDDRRTDLSLSFSEKRLISHHLTRISKVPEELHGYLLNQMTIAHYAIIFNDYIMLNRFLDLEPKLLDMTCSMLTGKAKLENNAQITFFDTIVKNNKFYSRIGIKEEENNLYTHVINSSCNNIKLSCAANVSLLHLAARLGREVILATLGSRHPNPAILDSHNKTSQDYLKISMIEGIVEDNPSSRGMFKALELFTKYKRQPALPEVNKLFHYKGYDLLYNTSRKVAVFVRQRLSKNSLSLATFR